MSTIYDVIKRPVITEKGLTLKENDRTLCFEVADNASKTQIQEAVEQLFKVKVQHVRTMIVPGKDAPPRQVHRLPLGLEEGVRHASRRRKDDRVRGELLMGIKTFRPKTHSLRFKTVIDYKQDLTTDEPHKPLLEPKNRINGRNNYGQIDGSASRRRKQEALSHHRFQARQGRHSREGRNDRVRSEPFGVHRAAELRRRRAPLHSAAGRAEGRHVCGRRPEADILVGNALPLKNIPLGTTVHNIELRPGKGAQMARSAGAAAQLVAKEGGYAHVKLPSGEVRLVNVECMATIGQVGNLDHENVTIGKAGRMRHMGIRPTVRGVVMNPVDHPHGGGEGRVKGYHPMTPWGKPTLGYKTRNNKRTDKFIVKRKTK